MLRCQKSRHRCVFEALQPELATARRGFVQLSELSCVTTFDTPLQRPTAFWQLDGASRVFPIKRSNPTCPNRDTTLFPDRPQPGIGEVFVYRYSTDSAAARPPRTSAILFGCGL